MHQGLSNQHRIAILEEGMKFSKTSIPPDDAQFLETRKFQRNEIASFFHIPPHMIGDLERATFSNIEEQALEFVVYTMRPWLIRWEQAINTKLLNPLDEGQYFSEFLVDGLLRGNQQARFTSYATGRQWGWLSANDIRELENQNPLPGEEGNIYLNPLNMVPALQLLQPNNNQGKGGTSGTQIN
jgi:HK97 family phage portal protein